MNLALTRTLAGLVDRATAKPAVHRGELISVQQLRGLAVLMVLLVHVEDIAPRLAGWTAEQSAYARLIGYSAPDMFFVISGFIMSYITFSVPFEPRRWLVSRLMRIYPMYMLFTLMVMGLWLLNPQMTMGSGRHDWGSVALSLLGLPQERLPLLFVGWTIEHEIVFYATVFLTATFLGRERLLPVLVVLSALALLRAWWAANTGQQVWDFHLTSLFMLQFAMGAAVHHFWRRLQSLGWWPPLLASAVLLAMAAVWAHPGTIGHEQVVRVVLFGGSYSLLLLAMLNLEHQRRQAGREPRHRDVMTRIGDASYSIYLTHPFVVGIFGKIFPRLDAPGWSHWPWLAAALAAILVVGHLTHLLLEQPIIEMGKRLARRQPAATPKKEMSA